MIRPVASLLTVALALAVVSVGAEQAATRKALMNPAGLKAQAPAAYKVKFDTSVGEFVIQVTRDWAPNGADRFYNLVKNGFYDDARFFRAIPNFMVQFGIHADPAVSAVWRDAQIPVDPVKQSNKRGFVTFAMGASPVHPHHAGVHQLPRQHQPRLPWASRPSARWSPAWTSSTRSTRATARARRAARGPDQGRVQAEGNAYLIKSFPEAGLHQEGDGRAVNGTAPSATRRWRPGLAHCLCGPADFPCRRAHRRVR